MGSLPDCEKHVREALRLLDSPIPSSTVQFALGLLPQLIRQVYHRIYPSRYVRLASNEKGRERAIEIARLYELMSRVYFYSNETLPVIYIVLRFLNEAEKAGKTPELAIAYASLAVIVGFVQLHDLAGSYVERAIAAAKEVNQPANLVTINVVTGVYNLMVGKWDEVRALALEGKVISEQLGDYRQWGDTTVLAAESAFISGDIEYAMKFHTILLEEAIRRRNPLQQCWALFGVAANNIRRGEEAQAIRMLEEALQILAELPNLASSINTNGQLAMAHFRLGDDVRAISHAAKVLELAADISPTVYSLHLGYSASAEVFFGLWERALQNPDQKADATKFKELAEKAIKLLRTFGKIFPIGRPYLAYYEGWHQWLTGKHQNAIQSWNKGLEAAIKFRTLYEEGLLRARLVAVLKDSPDEQRKHMDHAIQIFEKMSAVHELQSLRSVEIK